MIGPESGPERYTVNFVDEVGMEQAASKFSVGDGLESKPFLELYEFSNALVLMGPEGRSRDFTVLVLFTFLKQALGAQVAAHVIGTKWGRVAQRFDTDGLTGLAGRRDLSFPQTGDGRPGM